VKSQPVASDNVVSSVRPQVDKPIGAARALAHRLFATVSPQLAVALEDGTPLYEPAGEVKATIVVHDLGALRALTWGPSGQAAATAVVDGALSVRGDVEYAISVVERMSGAISIREWLAIMGLATQLPARRRNRVASVRRQPFRARGPKHSRDRDRAAIEYHYDVSNEFFALWLDRELTYSCAYFRNEDVSLDRAQLDKLDHICRKLRLREGERFLDVGCGWGSLVRFAAREYGAISVGITLSRRQLEYARSRIAAEGLERRCSVELRDYRDVAPLGRFHKAASVGMVEHVGTRRLPEYFRCVSDALEPGGLFMNHGIASQVHRRGIRFALIDRYVFPDGDLPRLEEVVAAAEGSGFEVRDVENLREHYARTLRHWVRRLEAQESKARAMVGDETYNVWRFYMAGSAHGFAIGRMGIDQVLLAKPLADGSAAVPGTREDIYRE
jgi:cyclopropane-fatty-acyl-phospholipid synthase